MRNYYEILGLEQDASLEEIKIAYKALVKKFHPDVNPQQREFFEKKSKAINEAYETLNDSNKKYYYDIKLREFLNNTRQNSNYNQQKEEELRKREEEFIRKQNEANRKQREREENLKHKEDEINRQTSQKKGISNKKEQIKFPIIIGVIVGLIQFATIFIEQSKNKIGGFVLLSFFCISFLLFVILSFVSYFLSRKENITTLTVCFSVFINELIIVCSTYIGAFRVLNNPEDREGLIYLSMSTFWYFVFKFLIFVIYRYFLNKRKQLLPWRIYITDFLLYFVTLLPAGLMYFNAWFVIVGIIFTFFCFYFTLKHLYENIDKDYLLF